MSSDQPLLHGEDLNSYRLVTTAEQMAEELVSPVEPHGVGAQEPFHACDQVGLRGFDHQVEMVSHHTPGVDLPVGLGANFGKGFKETPPVQIVVENGFAAVAPVHQVVDGSRILDAQLSTHAPRLAHAFLAVKC